MKCSGVCVIAMPNNDDFVHCLVSLVHRTLKLIGIVGCKYFQTHSPHSLRVVLFFRFSGSFPFCHCFIALFIACCVILSHCITMLEVRSFC